VVVGIRNKCVVSKAHNERVGSDATDEGVIIIAASKVIITRFRWQLALRLRLLAELAQHFKGVNSAFVSVVPMKLIGIATDRLNGPRLGGLSLFDRDDR
jgi:hypothetical protein